MGILVDCIDLSKWEDLFLYDYHNEKKIKIINGLKIKYGDKKFTRNKWNKITEIAFENYYTIKINK